MKKSKQALFQSVISLLLCFSMLVGTTFAWFTDGVSSGNNLIAAGNLDVELEYMDRNGQWQKVTEATEVLDKDALWEPGHTEVAYLRISNAGDLALKYALGINIVSEIGSTNAAGEAFKLSDHIRFGVVESESETTYADRMAARNALSETKLINAGYTSQYSLYPETGRDVRYATLVVYMPEDVGNVANYATGANPPEIQLGIELVATQEVLESDSFGSDYDTNAEMPGFSFPENVFGENASTGVSKDNENKTSESVTIQGATTNAVIPVGVQLEENVDKLTLEVTSMTESQANITLGENDAVRSLNVHVEGVSKDNTMPNPVVDSGVVISVTSLHDDGINMGTFTPDTKNWENGKIKFNQTGIVKVTIQDYDYCKPTELIVEVIDATNLTSATGTTTGGTFVLVSDVNASSYVNYWNATVYGNGFTYSLKGAPTAYNSKQGHGILIAQNTIFDNVKIVGDIYTGYGAYKDNDYYNTAVDVVSDTTFRNCYIANCAAPIKARGNVTIIDSTLYGGSVANLLLVSGTATLENVTTANYDDGRTVVGMGIVVHSDATESAKLVLNGKLTQYNFINESKVPTDSYAQELHKAMFDSSCTKYHFGTSPNRSVNTGIISLTDKFNRADITDNANTGYDGVSISRASINGYVYTQPNTSGSVNNNYSEDNFSGNQGDYLPTPNFSLSNQAVIGEDRYLKGDINGIEARYVEGEAAFTLDIDKLMTVEKYGISLPVSAVCKDAQGKEYTGVVTLSAAGTYTLKFTATDNLIYDKAGNLTGESKERFYTVSLTLVVAEPAIKDAVITVNKTALNGDYNESIGDRSYKFNPLDAITITDAEGAVDLKTNVDSTSVVYASSSSAFAGATTITVNYKDGRVLTITLGKPSLNSPGSSKAVTYANDGTIKSAGKVASKSATGGTWTVTSYSFKGTNGKTVTNNTVVTFTFPDKSCVTGDTLVMLADGTQKRIDEVTYSDELLVWDFFKGEYATVPSSIIFYHGDDNFDVLSLYFEDGTTVKTINVHGFFDMESNTFEFIDAGNVESYIGHRFAKVDGDSYKAVKLIGYDIAEEYTGCYSIQSAMHNNFITEGMFSLTIPAYEGWFDYFEIGDDMKYDEAKKQADIEKYGLYTYEEFADYVTYEQFIAFNGPYLKVLVGRGVVTFEDILNLIASYVPN